MSLTISVGLSSTSFPSTSSAFKSKPKWISLSHVKSTNSGMLYFASTISSLPNYTNSPIGKSSTLPRFKEETRLATSYVASFTLNFSCSSSMAKLALQFASKILDILQLFHMIWGIHLSIHLRAPHNIMPYVRHYFPQVMVSSRRFKLRDNPFQKLLPCTKSRGDHSIVKLNTTCGQNKFTFGKLHHQTESKFYQFFFMSRYTWYLLHTRK